MSIDISRRIKSISDNGFFVNAIIDCKTVGFDPNICKEIGKAWRKSLTRAKLASLTRPTAPQSRSLFSASFQTFCLTARAYLNKQKYGLCCSLTLLEKL